MVREASVAAFYERLRTAALSAPSSPVFIFPSARDTDSLCAFQILTLCLASDSVRYSAYPVTNSSDITNLPALSLNAEEATVVLLINWGASQNLLRLLNCGPNVHLFVVDSHRPIHLQNISALNSRVVVLYTEDDEREADIHYSFRLNELANSSELDEDESDAEDSDDDPEEDDDEDDEDDDLSFGVRKRRRSGDDAEQRGGGGGDPYIKELKRKKREYYSKGSYHGKPSGFLMFEMSHAARKNNNEHLWLACVSLTDQYVHERLTSERYLSGVMTLELHVTSSGNLERPTSATLKDGTRVRVPDVTRIIFEDEPRLMLLREWTLFDSMLCSSYVATKLKTWTDNGLHTLKLLLANMGIPLVECQQRYQHMSSETKRKLKSLFEEKESTSGLTDLYYRSFHRYHGYSAKVSAADVVFGVTALLETYKGGSSQSDSGGQFLDAVKALKADNLGLLQEGMHMAIKVQRAIIRQGSLAIARKDVIKSSGGFRALKLEMTAETELLAHPLSLTRFCYFLMDALKEQGSRPKPMVIAAPVPGSSKYYLIVGVAHRPRLGVPHGNKFGLAFREVAEIMGADFCQYAFESSWIRLDKDDVNSFMLRVAEKIRA
ncbi:unnamed protein product [Calypogeia fissa]